MRRSTRAALLSLACLFLGTLIGCAGAPKSAQGPPPVAKPVVAQDARAQIEMLTEEIKTRRQGSGGKSITSGGGAPTVQDPEPTLKATEAPSCEVVCDAAEGICSSSERICQIASRFTSEPDFQTRCTWSKGECESAKTQCADCQ